MPEVGVVLGGRVVPDQDEMRQNLGGHHSAGQQELGQAFPSHSSQLRTLKSLSALIKAIFSSSQEKQMYLNLNKVICPLFTVKKIREKIKRKKYKPSFLPNSKDLYIIMH